MFSPVTAGSLCDVSFYSSINLLFFHHTLCAHVSSQLVTSAGSFSCVGTMTFKSLLMFLIRLQCISAYHGYLGSQLC